MIARRKARTQRNVTPESKGDPRRGRSEPRQTRGTIEGAKPRPKERPPLRSDDKATWWPGTGFEAGAVGPILDRSLFKSSGRCTRRAPRHAGIILTPAERSRVRIQFAKVGSCGSYYAAFDRYESRPDGLYQHRIATRMRCGLHLCPTCGAELRKRQAVRCEGNWRMFLTLTMPDKPRSAGECWRRASRWVGRLTSAIRKEAKRCKNAAIRISKASVEKIDIENAKLDEGCRKSPHLQMAWCLEPHKSGFPHIHLATNAFYVNFNWIRAVWRRILGVPWVWVDGRRVWDIKGVCRYLSKYISKTQLTPEIGAIMHRKRAWASTRPKAPDPEPLWTRNLGIKPNEAYNSTVNPEVSASGGGWKVELSSEGKYAIFSRKVTAKDEIETQIEMARGMEAREGDPENERHKMLIAWHLSGIDPGERLSPDAERARAGIRRW